MQILLPVYDSAGSPFPANVYHKVRAKLTEKFGGLTTYSRAPAEGLWSKGSEVKRDDIIVLRSWPNRSIVLGGRNSNGRSNESSAKTRLLCGPSLTRHFESRLTAGEIPPVGEHSKYG